MLTNNVFKNSNAKNETNTHYLLLLREDRLIEHRNKNK